MINDQKREEKRWHLLVIGSVVIPVFSRQSLIAEPYGYYTSFLDVRNLMPGTFQELPGGALEPDQPRVRD